MPKPVYVSNLALKSNNPVRKPNHEWDLQGASSGTDPLSEKNLEWLATQPAMARNKEEYKDLMMRSEGRGVGKRRRTRKKGGNAAHP